MGKAAKNRSNKNALNSMAALQKITKKQRRNLARRQQLNNNPQNSNNNFDNSNQSHGFGGGGGGGGKKNKNNAPHYHLWNNNKFNNNNNHNGNGNHPSFPHHRQQGYKRRHPPVDSPGYESPTNEKSRRSLSPIKDENGLILTEEEQKKYYRKKGDDYELRMQSVDDISSFTSKNILALVAGLTNDPESSEEEEEETDVGEELNTTATTTTTTTDTTHFNDSVDKHPQQKNKQQLPSPPKINKRLFSPRLPQIDLIDLENDGGDIISENDEDDVIILTSSRQQQQRLRRKNNNRQRKFKRLVINKRRILARRRPKPKSGIPILIEIEDSDSNSDSIIILDNNDKQQQKQEEKQLPILNSNSISPITKIVVEEKEIATIKNNSSSVNENIVSGGVVDADQKNGDSRQQENNKIVDVVESSQILSTTTSNNNNNNSTAVTTFSSLIIQQQENNGEMVNRILTSLASSSSNISEKIIRRFRYPQTPVRAMRLNEHLDSLSYYIFKNRGFTLRCPEPFVALGNVDTTKYFRIVSYNILCQSTMERTTNLYKHLQENDLLKDWDHRWPLLYQELLNLNGDIYCLQEVEQTKLNNYFHDLLMKTKGMHSFYTFRGGPADELAKDGCAIYWNPIKFSCEEKIPIMLNYRTPGLDRPNCAQICRLKHKKTGSELIVVNTHILFNPQRGDVKLYQLSVIFAYLQTMRTKNQPVIFCGDFNLEPNSLLYKFITEGNINCEKTECIPKLMSGRRKNSNQTPMEEFSIPPLSRVSNNCSFKNEIKKNGNVKEISHPFIWESVYKHFTFDKQPEVSTYHSQGASNPDFIFYTVKEKKVVEEVEDAMDITESGLFLHRRLSLPDKNILSEWSECLPNIFSGSDHIPLLAEFSFP